MINILKDIRNLASNTVLCIHTNISHSESIQETSELLAVHRDPNNFPLKLTYYWPPLSRSWKAVSLSLMVNITTRRQVQLWVTNWYSLMPTYLCPILRRNMLTPTIINPFYGGGLQMIYSLFEPMAWINWYNS